MPYLFVLTAVTFAGYYLWLTIAHGKAFKFQMWFTPVFIALALSTWFAIGSFKGYPTHDPTPEKFNLHWFIIHEKKNIFIWISKDGKPKPEPRVHAIPYSKKTHKQLLALRRGLATGKVRIRGRRKGKKGFGTKLKPEHYRFYKFNQKVFPPKGR